MLRAAVDDCPDRVFVDFAGDSYTYADVWLRATRVARGLRRAGVQPGEVVAAMLDNNVDNLASWYGANLVSAIWVGVNTALRGEFLRHVIADSTAKAVFCEDEFVPRFEQIGPVLRDDMVLLARGAGQHGSVTTMAVEAMESYLVDGSDDGWYTTPRPDDASLIIYTGGTTGPSKGCVIGNGYVMNLCRRYLESTGRASGEVNWSPLPMFHFNILAQTITSTVALRGSAAIAPRFSVSRFWPEIERTNARVVNLLGSMGALIAKMPDSDAMKRCFGQIRVVHGAPFPGELQQIWRERFGAAEVGGGVYGLTEAVPLTTLRCGTPAPPGTSGKRNEADFEVRIVDDLDRELAPGQVGEVVARPKRPDVMFQGYWRSPEATVEATRNLWFHTGDLGMFDDEGFFHFVDRKKDYLRRRGENISSVELETAYLAHPELDLVAVHAVPSELGEDDVKVTAVLTPGSALTPAELFEWSKGQIPYFALPRYIEFRDSLPMSAMGRVHKHKLRDEAGAPATWDREQAGATWERR
jgi:crotonobetaine/carnitine-CoA ligase